MNKLSFRAKTLLLSIQILSIAVIIGGVNYIYLRNITNEYNFIVEKSMPKEHHINQMFLDYQRVRIALRTLGLKDLSPETASQSLAEVQKAIDSYEKANLAYKALEFIPGQQEPYNKVDSAWQDFKATGGRAISLYKSGKPEDLDKVYEIFFDECPQKAAVFQEAITGLSNFHLEKANEKIASAASLAKQSASVALVLIIAGILYGLGSSLFFSSALAKGLRKVSETLTSGSSEVSAAVGILTQSSTELSSSATQQASALQQTSAAIEEIRAMVERNTENANQSAQSSEESKMKAEKGQQVMQEMLSAMGQIQSSNTTVMTEVAENNRKFAEIVDVIHEIGNKTKVINEIVFQTKLLSFNASVEAARAGEHGKGFAVVAEEVGNLAQMSGNAAQDISAMLDASISKVDAIIEETKTRMTRLQNEAQSSVDRGNSIAQECGQVLGEILESATHVSSMAREISVAGNEQLSGVTEIAKALQQLETATQSNASSAHQTSDSASMLSSQVETLKDVTEQLEAIVEGAGHTQTVSKFVWKDQYALGVDNMDDEHKILIDRINDLATAVVQSKGKSEKIRGPFKDLAAYVIEHFEHEEEFMESINYPELEKHRRVHANLIARVQDFGRQIDQNRLNGGELTAFLNDWLIQHILGVDMKYARHHRYQHLNNVSKKAA